MLQESFFASKHWKYYAKAGVSAPVGRSLRPSLKMASRSLVSAAPEAGAELVRSWAGVSAPPESPHPQAGVSAPCFLFLIAQYVGTTRCACGVGPEGPRSFRTAGVSAPPGRSLRTQVFLERWLELVGSPRSASGVRPESPHQCGVSGLAVRRLRTK